MSSSRPKRGNPQQGYVLLTLLLMMAVMGIVAATMVTSFKFDIRRDREEEMIHRGVQYSRAIRAYYRKFGRYPATIENLENTNQQRFLRKRYKDPLTKREFRLLHFGEAKLALNGMGSGVIPGASTLGSNGKLTPNDGSNSTFGNSTFGQTAQTTQKVAAGTAQTADAGSDSGAAAPTGSDNNVDTGDQGSPEQSAQTFGGLPIVGVASTSKEPTIREFDRKKKYNEWQFVFDPSLDRGFLITEPYQPQLQMFGMNPQNVNGPGQNPTPGLGTLAPGTGGNPGASGNAPGNTNEPTDTPVQQ